MLQPQCHCVPGVGTSLRTCFQMGDGNPLPMLVWVYHCSGPHLLERSWLIHLDLFLSIRDSVSLCSRPGSPRTHVRLLFRNDTGYGLRHCDSKLACCCLILDYGLNKSFEVVFQQCWGGAAAFRLSRLRVYKTILGNFCLLISLQAKENPCHI